jgi:hypothetical protein
MLVDEDALDTPYWGPMDGGQTKMSPWAAYLHPGDLLVITYGTGLDAHDHHDSDGNMAPLPFLHKIGVWALPQATFERGTIGMYLGTCWTHEFMSQRGRLTPLVKQVERHVVCIGGSKYFILDFDHFSRIEHIDA